MKRCLICDDWTSGSLSVNGNFCAAICPECRAVEDKAADMAAQDVAATIDLAKAVKTYDQMRKAGYSAKRNIPSGHSLN